MPKSTPATPAVTITTAPDAAPLSGPTPAQMLEVVGRLYNSGRYREAEQGCRNLIARAPNFPDAFNVLGVVLNALGRPDEAVVQLRKAIALSPKIPSYYANLGEIERQRKDLDAAEAALKKAIELDPKSAQALSNLGIVHFDRKAFEEAAHVYERALELQPNFPEANNNLGNAYRALERRVDALRAYQRAVAQREAYPEAYNNMASALQEGQDGEAAEHAYRKAILLKPDYIEAYNNYAMLLNHTDRTDEALRILGDALRVDERSVATLVNVARTQLKRSAYPVAEQAVKLAIDADPTKAEPHSVMAEIMHELDRSQEALTHIERGLELEPEAADLYSFYGVLLKAVGRIEEARVAVRKSLEMNPKLYGAYSNLVDLETFHKDHELLAQMQDLLASADDANTERYLPVHFVLGKALEDSGDYPKALEHYNIGAKLRRGQLKYDEADTLAFFKTIQDQFTKETFENRSFEGNPSNVPVFIVGMPRSGSTLVEQILSSHPKTYGAGEIKVLHRALSTLRDRFPMIPKFPAMVGALDPDQFAQVASTYLADVQREAGGAARVTDKLLTNFFFIGLINLLFPNAKIIHTRRNPVDTCLSAYSKLFKDDMPHSYDLGEIGRYYKAYEGLMAHWETVLPPGVMRTVDYEDVIADTEGNARALVAHIGLEWNDACLEFYKSSRAVKTASVVQVRKPVYTTSVERWRRYGDGLAPLIAALDFDPAVKRGSKAKAKAAPTAKAAAEPVKSAPKAKAKPQAKAEPQPKPKAQPQAKVVAKPQSKAAPAAKAKSEPKAAAKPKSAAKSGGKTPAKGR